MIHMTCVVCRDEFPCTPGGGVLASVYEPAGPPRVVYGGGTIGMLEDAPLAVKYIGIGCSRECCRMIELAYAIARNKVPPAGVEPA